MVVLNNVAAKIFTPFILLFRKITSYIYSILITIPDLTQQGVLYLGFIFFIFMISVTQRDPMLFQVAIICYLIFGGSFIFSYINLSGLTCNRRTPRFIFAKESFVIKVTIENQKKNIETFWVTLEDDFYKKEHHTSLTCISIAPQSCLEREFLTVVHRRGVYREFSYRLISTFPFGFFMKEKIRTENAELTVFPMAMDELELNSLLPIGYSGHEVGLVPSAVAIALGATSIERHITLDRAMWGSDQAASVEPGGFERLVKYIRVTEAAMGDGVKKVYESEKGSMKKLRRVVSE